jgi:hypothetical protein
MLNVLYNLLTRVGNGEEVTFPNQNSGRPNSSTSSTPLLPTHRRRRSTSERLTQRQLMEQLARRRIINNQESGVQIEVNGSVNQFRQWSQANPQGAASFPDYLRTFIEECRAQKCLLSRDQERAIIADKLGSEVVQAIKATNERPRNDPDDGCSSAAAMHYPFVRFINPANTQLELHLVGYMDPNHWENIGDCSFKLKEAASPSAAIEPRYRKKHPASALRGEMVCLGNDQFEGFGMTSGSLSEVKTLLEDAFNVPPNARDMDHPAYDDDLVDATDPKVLGWWDQLAIRLDPAKVRALMASSR